MKYQYIIGYIEDEEYRIGLVEFSGEFADGRNPYEFLGYANEKKYYGEREYAVEIDGKLLRIFGKRSSTGVPAEFETEEYYTKQYFISWDEEYDYHRNNLIFPPAEQKTIKDLYIDLQ